MGKSAKRPRRDGELLAAGYRARERRRNAAVDRELGDGRVICTRCGATLASFGTACTAALDDACQGYLVIEQVRAAN